jgi:hypothetical protein
MRDIVPDERRGITPKGARPCGARLCRPSDFVAPLGRAPSPPSAPFLAEKRHRAIMVPQSHQDRLYPALGTINRVSHAAAPAAAPVAMVPHAMSITVTFRLQTFSVA